MGNLKQFIEETKKNSGATYNLVTGELNPKSGYFVALKKHEKVHKLRKDNSLIIQDYVLKNSVALCNQKLYLGSWIDSNIIYLDVVLHFDSLDLALLAGLSEGQKSIYDANNKKVITL